MKKRIASIFIALMILAICTPLDAHAITYGMNMTPPSTISTYIIFANDASNDYYLLQPVNSNSYFYLDATGHLVCNGTSNWLENKNNDGKTWTNTWMGMPAFTQLGPIMTNNSNLILNGNIPIYSNYTRTDYFYNPVPLGNISLNMTGTNTILNAQTDTLNNQIINTNNLLSLIKDRTGLTSSQSNDLSQLNNIQVSLANQNVLLTAIDGDIQSSSKGTTNIITNEGITTAQAISMVTALGSIDSNSKKQIDAIYTLIGFVLVFGVYMVIKDINRWFANMISMGS